MSMARTIISGNEVLCSGSLVVHAGEHANIYPFGHDAAYNVRFEFSYADFYKKPSLKDFFAGEKTTVFRVERQFVDGSLFSTARPVEFAREDDGRSAYFISLMFTTSGTVDDHTILINYTIVQRFLDREVG